MRDLAAFQRLGSFPDAVTPIITGGEKNEAGNAGCEVCNFHGEESRKDGWGGFGEKP
jgi:hypothetical protein